jgi:hypothetical protein
MSLNPSCNSVQGKPFPTLGDPPFRLERLTIAKSELLEAFPEATFDIIKSQTIEVYREGSEPHRLARMGISFGVQAKEEDIENITVFDALGHSHGWAFRRAWYYWVCTTDENNAIPETTAQELNKVWGEQVRAEGFAGGISDLHGPMSSYHVDTLEGLKALAKVIHAQAEEDF